MSPDLYIQDVTLRDGMHAVRHRITPETVAAIAGAAQSVGRFARSFKPGETLAGLDFLPGGVVEPNFDPAHDRRLRRLLALPGVTWGVGLPSGSALLLGPDGTFEVIGTVFRVEGVDGDLEALTER